MTTKLRGGDAPTKSLSQELHKLIDEPKVQQGITALGETLLDRAESIYAQTKGIRTLAMNAYRNPTRFGCSTVVLASGLANIYSGNLITGGVETVLGAKELYNQCTGGDNSTLQRLLDDINADVDFVRSLEEGQQKSYSVIDENLKLIGGDVETLFNKLEEIRTLNTDSIRSLDEAKTQAEAKGMEAEEAFRTALTLFKETKESFGESKDIYTQCADQFQLIQTIAKEQDSSLPILEKMNALVTTAEKATDFCAEGKKKLDNADKKFSEAMTALAGAMQLKNEAIEMISKTVQSAKDGFKAGIEKAEYTNQCQETIKATQRELEEVKERSNDIMNLLSEMSEDIQKAKTEASRKLDPSDVVVAVGTGIVLAPTGPITAFAAGITAAYAWHNGSAIAQTTKRVYNYFFSAPQPLVAPVSAQEVLRVKFQERSTGYYGAWVKGRQSYTKGTVDINVGGDEVLKLDVDLNDPRYPISKENLFTLYDRMFSKVKKGLLEPAYCKSILSRLKSEIIPRGGLNPDTKGLISDKQATNGLVKAILKFCG